MHEIDLFGRPRHNYFQRFLIVRTPVRPSKVKLDRYIFKVLYKKNYLITILSGSGAGRVDHCWFLFNDELFRQCLYVCPYVHKISLKTKILLIICVTYHVDHFFQNTLMVARSYHPSNFFISPMSAPDLAVLANTFYGASSGSPKVLASPSKDPMISNLKISLLDQV